MRPEVLAVRPYKQGVQAPKNGFKLSSNEVPFEPLPSVLKRIHEVNDFNRYADASMVELRDQIAAKFQVTIDEVHVASGSVAILYQLIHAAVGRGEEYVYPWPSFEAYPALGISSGGVPVPVPLTAEHRHDFEAMLAAITDRTRAILLCSPNNPTSTIIERAEFDDFMSRVPRDVLVVLDEAYREFITSDSAVFGEEVVRDFPQLVVLRTFSKAYGLAGLRIGFAVGNASILNAARAVSIPLSVTKIASEGALASLEAEEELAARINELSLQRSDLVKQLRNLGFTVPDSHGNFAWIALGEQSQAFAEFFGDEGVVVRPFAPNGVRVSVGEPESIPRVIELASRFMERHPELRQEDY